MSSTTTPLRHFNFDTFGGREIASSRLRAWMLADRLNQLGYMATLNASVAVDVQIFQKRIDLDRLRHAREHGALVVLDFDDNVLLKETGTRERYLAFMNGADVVTVGSRRLVEIAGRYHDRVFLLPNPLDVHPHSGTKSRYEWQGRLGWFGNASGLVALEDIGMREATTVVSDQGEVQWSLDTIDATLQTFDLVLIPVRWDGWTEAKNANRLLKCVALGVPFLASNTPEHAEAVRELGLPDWLLVGGQEDWRARVVLVHERYLELPEALSQAARLARTRYAIAEIAERWLEHVVLLGRSGRRPLDLSTEARARLGDVDVLILNENEPELASRTIESLRLDDVMYRSVRLVSALPLSKAPPSGLTTVEQLDRHDDFFKIYSTMTTASLGCGGTAVLVIRAGVELARGFFEELDHLDLTGGVHLFALQRASPDLSLTPQPPSRLDELLAQPHIPSLYLCPAQCVRAHGGLRAIFGAFASWELLIGVITQRGATLQDVPGPLALVEARTERRTPVESYRLYLDRTHSPLAETVGGWDRLQFVWQSAVIEAHRATFGRYVSTIVPRLTSECSRLATSPSPGPWHEDGFTKLAAQWLDRLARDVSEEPPRLIRQPHGAVYLIDQGHRREVSSALLVEALERTFGPTASATDADIAGWEDGPPVVVFANEEHEHFLIAGAKRYPVSGLLLPWPVASGDLERFELAQRVIEAGP